MLRKLFLGAVAVCCVTAVSLPLALGQQKTGGNKPAAPSKQNVVPSKSGVRIDNIKSRGVTVDKLGGNGPKAATAIIITVNANKDKLRGNDGRKAATAILITVNANTPNGSMSGGMKSRFPNLVPAPGASPTPK
jgi:hypothetical protein